LPGVPALTVTASPLYTVPSKADLLELADCIGDVTEQPTMRQGNVEATATRVTLAILDRRTYEPPGEGRADKLRLDFNENTVGCSPRVLERLRGATLVSLTET